MVDIGMMMKLGGLWAKFSKNHPKFPQFIKALQKKSIIVDTIIDLKLTYPDSETLDTNLKITADDLAMMEELKKLKK